MYCKNCGAQIEDNVLQCPYCDFENEKVAQKEQDAHIEYYDNKTKKLKQLPDKIVNKTTKYLLMAAGAVFVLFIIVLVVVFIVSSIKSKTDLPMQEKHLKKLEEYYVSGQYDKLGEYLDEKDLHGGSYQKYTVADNLYYFMELEINSLKQNYEYAVKIDIDETYLASNLEEIFKNMIKIEGLRDDGFKYGEEAAAVYVENEYKNALKTYAFLTEEEIEAVTLDYIDYDYKELARLVKTRMETR